MSAEVPEKPESAKVVATGFQISTRPATPPQLVALPPMATCKSSEGIGEDGTEEEGSGGVRAERNRKKAAAELEQNVTDKQRLRLKLPAPHFPANKRKARTFPSK